jgi:TIR domain
MNAATRIELIRQRQPDVLRLAHWVCLAARVDSGLLRRARLRMMPGASAALEADLWFSPLVEIRGPRSILFYAEVASLLRAELSMNEMALRRAWDLTRERHEYLPDLVCLEEELTWAALTGGSGADLQVTEKLRPVIKALVDEQQLGLGRWAVSMLPRLPQVARTSSAARLLLAVSEFKLYDGYLGVGPEGVSSLPGEARALLMPERPRVEVGVQLRGGRLEITEPPAAGARVIRVPETTPRSLDLRWSRGGIERRLDIYWLPGEQAHADGLSTPLTLRTLADDEYRLTSRQAFESSMRAKVRPFLVCLLDREGVPTGTGWLVSERHVLTGSEALYEAQKSSPRGDSVDAEVSVHFPFLDQEILRARVVRYEEAYGTSYDVKGYEGLVLLELQGGAGNMTRPAWFNSGPLRARQLGYAFGYPVRSVEGAWLRLITQPSAIDDEPNFIKPDVDIASAVPNSWSGSPLVSRQDGAVLGAYRLAYLSDESRPTFVPVQELARLFPEAFPQPRKILILHSRADEQWKRRLVTRLQRDRRQLFFIDTWADRRVMGRTWFQEFQKELNTSDAVILLISADFLSSDFLQKEEIAYTLQRGTARGHLIFPVVIRPSAWKAVKWLSELQVLPRDGQPLDVLGSRVESNRRLTDIAAEISAHLDDRRSGSTRQKSEPEHVSITRLPVTAPSFFGREQELDMLDEAWLDPDSHVVTLVAWGGVGKSALVNHWLARMARDDYRGAQRVYGWSFYSQGTTDRAVSADQFIQAALVFFGDPDPSRGTPWDKGVRLARLVGRGRALLVLDGLEPLQYPPGPGPEEGRLKEQSMQALLRGLAAYNEGLCVVTTRVRVTDLAEFEGGTVTRMDLETLSPEAGAVLLRTQGVRGSKEELEEASREFGGHPLALTLLGSHLRDVYGGDVRRRAEVRGLESDERYGGHARRVLASYERWFGEGPELSVLRLLGLFNGPADKGSLGALRAAPAIQGLTDALQGVDERAWQQTLSRLRRAQLIAERSGDRPDTLDTHPLVREHFGQQLMQQQPAAWREGHGRLYEHLKNTSREFPNTIEEMAVLYAAVEHGCAAGKHQEVLEDVYWRRIRRGTQSFNTARLGAVAADLSALAGFFEEPWRRPVRGLNEQSKTFVLSQAGVNLQWLGRTHEATLTMQAALEAYASRADIRNAAISASSLSRMLRTSGRLAEAESSARRAVELSGRAGGDVLPSVDGSAALASVLHQCGHLSEAEAAFRDAEGRQREAQPDYPLLYSVQGFEFCDLLLDQEKREEVLARTARTLEWAKQAGSVLDTALDHLSLGRAYLLQTRGEYAGDPKQAADHFGQALEGLRQAGHIELLLRGLLGSSELQRKRLEIQLAHADVAEATAIATRGGMALYQADCLIEYTFLYLAEGNTERAGESLRQASEMVERTGYHRRDLALSTLAAYLGEK